MAYLDKKLRIRKSLIPGAGKGLFTTVDIKKGTRITEYKGKKCLWRDVKKTDGYNTYLMRISRTMAIDGQPFLKLLGRYANDAKGLVRIPGLRNNTEYAQYGMRVYLEATRPIAAGEEIFVDYGREFWQLQRKLMREKKS